MISPPCEDPRVVSPSSDVPFIPPRTGHPENDHSDDTDEDDEDATAGDRDGVEATDYRVN
jgi:hypothetical protein